MYEKIEPINSMSMQIRYEIATLPKEQILIPNFNSIN